MLPGYDTSETNGHGTRTTRGGRVRRHTVSFMAACAFLIAASPVAQACTGCGVGTSSNPAPVSDPLAAAAAQAAYYNSLPPQSPPQDPNAGKVSALGTPSGTPAGPTWTSCGGDHSTAIAWPAGGAPSVADVNAGIDVIWPEPLPNNGRGYTWGCFTGTVFVTSPPSAPAVCEVSSDIAGGPVVILSQSVSPFLASDKIVSHIGLMPPPDSTVTGTAGPYSYLMTTRWTSLADHPDRWDWNDGTITDGQSDGTGTHGYANVSGSGSVPAHGVTISVTRWWKPLCGTQVVDTSQAPGSAHYYVRNEPSGSTGCHASHNAPIPLIQTFKETAPLAPHLIRQIESVPIAA
jgi:hypothetical protein